MDNSRFRSEDCDAGKHDECAKSPMIGICGCECHDYLDEMDAMLYRQAVTKAGQERK